jgi:predicted helicase
MRNFIWRKSSTLCILDLHGGAIQEETKPPPGECDQNVFEIKQGVAISISTVVPELRSNPLRIYAELWGDQPSKYDELGKRSATSGTGTQLAATPPRYDFVPNASVELDSEYSGFIAINELFPVGSTGIQTSRDAYVIDFEKSALQDRFNEFCDIKLKDDYFRTRYGLEDGRNWSLADARRKLRGDSEWSSRIVKCQFRPLDIRWMLYHSSVINWPRPEVMPNMLRRNIALIAPRNYQGGRFDAALVSRFISEVKTGESTRGSYCYPLYVYGNTGLFSGKNNQPAHNLNEVAMGKLSRSLQLEFIAFGPGDLKSNFGPEDFLHYLYAALYSNAYRERYSPLIKNGFPRLPLTGNLELFRALAGLGGELVALHLLESPKLDTPITEFIGGRSPEVEKVSWSKHTVWLDKAQTTGFKGVREDVWNFHIGGYQVCEKWLKDRKGRTLSADDRAHYQKIVIALSETIRLMAEIDAVIEKHGGWPLK